MDIVEWLRALEAWHKAKPKFGDLDTVFGSAADEIERLRAGRPRWISTKERVPEDDRTVLIWWLKAAIECRGWVPGAVRGRYIHVLGEWRPVGANGNFSNEVTHWMPLPEPPQEDD